MYREYHTPPWGVFQARFLDNQEGCQHQTIRLRKALRRRHVSAANIFGTDTISTVSDPSGSGRVDMLTGPVAAARVKSKHGMYLIRWSVGAYQGMLYFYPSAGGLKKTGHWGVIYTVVDGIALWYYTKVRYSSGNRAWLSTGCGHGRGGTASRDSPYLGQMICMICMICMIYSHYGSWCRYFRADTVDSCSLWSVWSVRSVWSVWSVWSSTCCRVGAV